MLWVAIALALWSHNLELVSDDNLRSVSLQRFWLCKLKMIETLSLIIRWQIRDPFNLSAINLFSETSHQSATIKADSLRIMTVSPQIQSVYEHVTVLQLS